MGTKDSRYTRVKPIFDQISQNKNWFNILFIFALNKYKISPFNPGNIIKENAFWGDKEKKLPPPQEYLNWMICNTDKLISNEPKYNTIDTNVKMLRQKLFKKDIDTFRKAKCSIINNHMDKWCIFEGPSAIDVFIETEDIIFIGEGKRTEAGITKGTTWNSRRDQIIRDIDCAFNYSSKKIYAFYILEETDGSLDKNWNKDLLCYNDIEYFKKSLPHRYDFELELIMQSYIGCLTWQEIGALFNIDWSKVPDHI